MSFNPHNSYDLRTTWRKISHLIRINPNLLFNWNDGTCLHNRYSYLFYTLRNTKILLIVATDKGFGSNDAGISANAAAFVLCIWDIREGESLESGIKQHRPAIPLLARYCLLPKMQGVQATTIAHCELTAVVMQEESLSASLPRTVVMDSMVARETTLHVRERDESSHRALIHNILPGIGKASVSRFKYHCDKFSTYPGPQVDLPLVISTQYSDFLHYVAARNRHFIAIYETWTCERPQSSSPSVQATQNPMYMISNHYPLPHCLRQS